MSLGLKLFQPSLVMKYSYQQIGRHSSFSCSFHLSAVASHVPHNVHHNLLHPSIAHFFLSFALHLLKVKNFKIMYSFVIPNKCGPIPRSTSHPLLHNSPVLNIALFYYSTIHSKAQTHIVQPDIRNSPDCR